MRLRPAAAKPLAWAASVIERVTRSRDHRGLGAALAMLTRASGEGRVRVDVRGVPVTIPAGDPYWARLLAPAYVYEPEVQWFVESVPFGFDFLDAGANIGYWSALVAAGDPEAAVVAIEPNPPALEFLRQNVPPQATIVQAAVVATDALEIDLFPAGTGMGIASSVVPELVPGAHDAAVGGTVRVPAVRLAEMADLCRRPGRPLLAKLDVEGLEADLLHQFLPEAGQDTAVIYEDHGRDVASAATAVVLSHRGWRAGLLTDHGVRWVASEAELAHLKTDPACGYNALAVPVAGPWAYLLSD